ncbi:MAG: sensor histidine kinase [bacterium]
MISKGLSILTIDSEKILLVLRNITGNAIKSTVRRGRVRILVRSICQGADVSVTDTAPGIPAGNLITIFEKFEQTTIEEMKRSRPQ